MPGAARYPATVDARFEPVIYGQVVHRGNPLAGAVLTLTDLAGRQLGRHCSDPGGCYRLDPPGAGSYLLVLDHHGDVAGATTTGPDGRFGFRALAQGLYTLTVCGTARHLVAHSIEIPAQGDVTHDVQLTARVQLVGRVHTGAGAPVSEALATVLDAQGHVVGSAITDTAGRFLVDGLHAGAYTVITTGYPPVTSKVHLEPGTPAETVITLRPPAPFAHDRAVLPPVAAVAVSGGG